MKFTICCGREKLIPIVSLVLQLILSSNRKMYTGVYINVFDLQELAKRQTKTFVLERQKDLWTEY